MTIRSCPCQKLGAIRPECARGIIGYYDPDVGTWRFDPLPCNLDAAQCIPHRSRSTPPDVACYRKGKRCADCGKPITNNARGHCRLCAAVVNGAKSKGGPPNEAWRTSMRRAPRLRGKRQT